MLDRSGMTCREPRPWAEGPDDQVARVDGDDGDLHDGDLHDGDLHDGVGNGDPHDGDLHDGVGNGDPHDGAPHDGDLHDGVGNGDDDAAPSSLDHEALTDDAC